MDLSLVIACYNEEEHLEHSFAKLMTVVSKKFSSFEIIIVEDKSTDKTLAIIHKLIKKYSSIKITLITHSKNEGRGKSIADGIKAARGMIVGYLDIDLEVSPVYIFDAINKLKFCDVVVGKREYGFSIVTIHRYIASKGYIQLVKMLLKLPISDSEAGFKFFNRKKILPVLRYATNHGWFWDTEIIVYAKRAGLSITEIPVIYKRLISKTSTVNTISDSIIYFKHLWKLYMKLGSKK